MKTLLKVKAARQLLRSTQINWQEQCLFDCDDILTGVIQELEAAEHRMHWTLRLQAFFKSLVSWASRQ